MSPLDEAAVRLAAGRLMARKAWTRRELEVRLLRKGAPPEIAAAVVADLTARGYLDDAQFARHWVETRASARLIGAVRLREELRARGVDPDVAEAALRDGAQAEHDLDRAMEAGRRKLRTLVSDEANPAAADPRQRDRAAVRLRDHLLRRGYPAGVVTRVVRTLLGL